jgi:hypothetical protein
MPHEYLLELREAQYLYQLQMTALTSAGSSTEIMPLGFPLLFQVIGKYLSRRNERHPLRNVHRE